MSKKKSDLKVALQRAPGIHWVCRLKNDLKSRYSLPIASLYLEHVSFLSAGCLLLLHFPGIGPVRVYEAIHLCRWVAQQYGK